MAMEDNDVLWISTRLPIGVDAELFAAKMREGDALERSGLTLGEIRVVPWDDSRGLLRMGDYVSVSLHVKDAAKHAAFRETLFRYWIEARLEDKCDLIVSEVV